MLFRSELVILFLQRELEKPILNEITDIDDKRAALGFLAFLGVLFILFPIPPSLAAGLGF